MRKVIIPTDFSENAKNALTQAIHFFKKEYCEFYIIHAYSDETYNANAHLSRALFDDVKELTKAKSNEQLMELLEYAQETTSCPKHHFKIRSVFQSLVDAIDDIVNQEGIDIVVMGTKGATDSKSIMFGSQTLQVVKYVDCPVLMIPSDYVFEQPKNILFPSNFLIPYSKRELKLLDYIGMDFKSKVHFLHQTDTTELSHRKEDNKFFLQESLNSCQQQVHFEKGTNLTETINAFIENHSINLLVMVNSRETYLENLLHKTTIDKIGLNVKIPFLVLQNIDRCEC